MTHPDAYSAQQTGNTPPTFGPVKRIGPATWEMDYSLHPGHNAHIEWDHEPTPDELSVAHNPPPMRLDPRGETLDGRMWKMGPVTVFRFKNVAPPRWVLPRLYPKRVRGGVALRFGWNFTAYEWSIHRTHPGRVSGSSGGDAQ